MDWKKADAVRMAYQRCAWALEDAGHDEITVKEMLERADIYRGIAEKAWKEANGRG